MGKNTFGAMVSLFLLSLVAVWINMSFIQYGVMEPLRSAHLLLAMLGMGFFLVQFILSSRIKWIERGFGLDKMLWYHRQSGRVATGFLFLHFSLVLVLDFSRGAAPILDGHRAYGLAALGIILVTASVASLHKRMGLRYETWKSIHLVNYLAFPLALVHIMLNPAQRGAPVWWGFAFTYAFLIAYRIYMIYVLRKNPYVVVGVTSENSDTWTLRFAGRPLKYLPGQFLHVQLHRRDGVSSSHPFTISSSPTEKLLGITPKASGDFTSTIGETEIGDQAYIDAPYGVFSFLRVPKNRPLVFIAGGIGITPFLSMLRYMHDRQVDREVYLFWGNRTENNLFSRAELAEMEEHLPRLKVILVMSDQPDWIGEEGRIDLDLLTGYLGDLAPMEFFLCGPPPMTKAIEKQLADYGVSRAQVHREVFEL